MQFEQGESQENTVIIVPKENEGQRVDVFLTSKLIELTRTHVQKLITAEKVLVNDKKVKANYKIQADDVIQLSIPEPEQGTVLPENLPLQILYEDDELIVVNKARGMVVHPAPGNVKGTLVNALLYHCTHLSGINGVIRPGIVHRLDKDTTGVMVVAKTDRAHLSLSKQIQERSASREYFALVQGVIGEEQGLIEAPIGRHPVDRKKMAVVFAHSKPAITRFHVVERFRGYTLVKCKLLTGRTHQIRVHMAYIHHPVVGDPIYGPTHSPFAQLIAGQALHSAKLSLTHPVTQKSLVFEAPMPADMTELLAFIRRRGT
ncbi:23S rRNA pseudouridine1911/1915/1917 synthase [Sporomusaceae bacterium BoRhaA]|uniref:RluA family pseudouridine synthase n=1 Tax=Pelorhabdus rhamnosifermentans TaxID=2772457 RepID=UPI001C0634C0|nr:RluA family pseudouridine synthase [Pelorhabdus rhamnosifermentans]MBU2700233.1 23S rRNA pseudouridine1911/1915/1917 synthase [Pelorhabdus rhamnosifermentans]